ncbi:MAG: DUF1304 domain-containing protein [Cyanobacteria bacterium SZAS LIN-3]|nr:DUF1304 domain-containing protein [Cyanobacteria bacterium SZAS LIN-3]
MHYVSAGLTIFVALSHLAFMYIEMFTWTTARTRKSFGLTEEFAVASKTLAANQGLYNGFLAAGLIWSLFAPAPTGWQLALFFNGCVLVAGVFGGLTATKKILLIQALPAALAIASLILTPH